MNLAERDYWLAFNVCGGFGPKRFAVVLKYFSSARQAWSAGKDEWEKLRLGLKVIDRLFSFKKEFDIVSYKLRLERCLIRFVVNIDKDYPDILKKIEVSPYLLYLKGSLLPQDNMSISVVGTRKVTSYGRAAAEKIVRSLSASGMTIVSGLARGIDGIAHRTALLYGGRTLAVVGHGLDSIYPSEHRLLADEIAKKGAVISQFPLDVRASVGTFPARNRIIAGLGLGTVVVEGLKDSGSLITADYARQMGRLVFAVPGPITSELSAAPFKLLKNGAKIVTSGEDIIKEFKVQGSLPKASHLGGQARFKAIFENLKLNEKEKKINFNNQSEEKIWKILSEGEKHIDQLARQSGLEPAEISAVLTVMELEGKVKSLGSGEYCL